MAATAAISSCFSATITANLHLKHTSSNNFLKLFSSSSSSLRQSPSLITSPNLWELSHFRRLPRISCIVAQEQTVGEQDQLIVEQESTIPLPPSSQSTKLYFGNLPYNCDSAQLAGIIQQFADPEMVEVLYDRDTGKSRGFAFVTMSCIEDCEAVIENLDRSQFGGRTMRVNFADRPQPKEPLYPETEFKLFVGNLSWSVTAESLSGVFQEYGNVIGARILYDGDTGRSRGYGFVCYSTKEEMDAAIEQLNGVELEGRAMRVSVAQGKKS
ncbi:31 kDa ribonucleoprotein, chloroplastic [Dioscorea cayenensis subsp. rotundata]|uniref:31 kDa ribonucleoprotein, chloroplastic n=1 Tax=Dioscorea cayennensis subsp. rotundata TaxID=55577 RepID=A0AB40C6V3_DIOCR|nr:31 kDa ribonucleoprotein, chloroplastic [Dioscorea cayenensis subsp. rotundata]